jgi:putative transposase
MACGDGVDVDLIRTGKPMGNAFVGTFSGRLHDECLDKHQFLSLEDAGAKTEAWRIDYNRHRPHSSLSHLTLDEFHRRRQVEPALKEVAGSTLELSR